MWCVLCDYLYISTSTSSCTYRKGTYPTSGIGANSSKTKQTSSKTEEVPVRLGKKPVKTKQS
jgi:hypothetical protein